MSLASNKPYNSRLLEDSLYVKSASLSTATASAALDFVQASPYPTTEQVIVQVATTALTTGIANGVTGSYALQNSADNLNWSSISELATFGSDLAATTAKVLLPPSVKRYVRVLATFADSASVAATYNDLTGSLTASVLF